MSPSKSLTAEGRRTPNRCAILLPPETRRKSLRDKQILITRPDGLVYGDVIHGMTRNRAQDNVAQISVWGIGA